MKIILLSKAEKQVQSTQDTLLADLLNKRIKYNPNYLMSIYSEALRDSITFEKKLKNFKVNRSLVLVFQYFILLETGSLHLLI
ncbi:MAG: hypothetical protein IPP71_05025 [Bacteroidetes bacterium]|nr:hypothetical protein [Bacteroidota bacterium]